MKAFGSFCLSRGESIQAWQTEPEVTSMTKRILAGILIATAALTGCSSGSDNNNSGGAPTAGEPTTGGGSTSVPEAIAIEDQWTSTCGDATLFGLSEDSQMKVGADSFSRVTRYHTTGTCSAEAIRLEQTGTYSQGADVQTGVKSIDFTVDHVQVTALNKAGADILRLANFCGISQWKVGVAQDVTSQSGSERCVPKLPQTIYQIYSVEGDNLFLGKGDDLTVPEKRPGELDRTKIYTRM